MDETIITFYENYGYPGIDKLHKLLKDAGHIYTKQQVKDVISKQKEYELHRKLPKQPMGHIVSIRSNEKWEIDLLDFQKYKQNNKGFQYCYICVDIFSRYAYVKPLKNKTQEETLQALKDSIKYFGDKPNNIISDNGSEFMGPFDKYCEENNIVHSKNIVGDHFALGIIDRFSKTIKDIIFKHFTRYNTTKWSDNINKLVLAYNTVGHSSLKGHTPRDVFNGGFKQLIEAINNHKMQVNASRVFNIKDGDTVRIKIEADFRKGYLPKWSKETYKVVQTQAGEAKLDNGKWMKTRNLQVIAHPQNESQNEEITELEKSEKMAKTERKLRQEGIEYQIDSLNKPRAKRNVKKVNYKV